MSEVDPAVRDDLRRAAVERFAGHFAEAERLLLWVAEHPRLRGSHASVVARAQVHATLAHAAAVNCMTPTSPP